MRVTTNVQMQITILHISTDFADRYSSKNKKATTGAIRQHAYVAGFMELLYLTQLVIE